MVYSSYMSCSRTSGADLIVLFCMGFESLDCVIGSGVLCEVVRRASSIVIESQTPTSCVSHF